MRGVRLQSVSVWAQIHNVPLEALCLENAITIGGYLGEVMIAENPHYNGRFLRNFLRSRVVLDLRKPLAAGFWLPRPDGKKVWLSIRYEKLQSFCYTCGKIGHDYRCCGSEKVMSMLNRNEPRYGEWITTNACRSWEDVLVVVKDEWSRFCGNGKGITNDMRKVTCPAATVPIIDKMKSKVVVEDRKDLEDRGYAEEEVRRNVQARMKVTETNEATGTNSGYTSDNTKPAPEMVKSTNKHREHELEMVPYNGRILHEVINHLDNLGLKRKVGEDWESAKSKRQRVMMKEPVRGPDIVSYAANLRKTKARIRRTGRRKKGEEKENILPDVPQQGRGYGDFDLSL
ncbi:hypothetical protein K1719_009332 [Acacia pycnantha]|nr:hypothetical protein K1719_009332 [Acacia pycnantha]